MNLAETIVVSGTPRSGTSLMMRIFLEVLGADMILGEEWPRRFDGLQQRPHEGAGAFEYRQYLEENTEKGQKRKAALENTRDMNPNGFWEMAWSVRGCRWNPAQKPIFDRIEANPGTVCKIVSGGLARSPIYRESGIHAT